MLISKFFGNLVYLYLFVILLFPMRMGPYSWLITLPILTFYIKIFTNRFPLWHWLILFWIGLLSVLVYLNSENHSVFIYSILAISILSLNQLNEKYLIINQITLRISGVILIIFLLLMWVLFRENERVAGWYGDPNFAALFLFSIVGMMLLLYKKINIKSYSQKFYLMTLLISIILLTGSRALMLSLILYIFIDSIEKLRQKKLCLLLLIIIAIIWQPIAFIILTEFDLQATGYNSNSIERLIILNDTSNFLRVELAYISLKEFIGQNIYQLVLGGYGGGDISVYSSNEEKNIVHNYFIQFLLHYGLIYTITIQAIIFMVVSKGTPNNLPFTAAMIFIAGVLSSIAIFLMFVILVIEKLYSENQNKIY